MSTEENKLIAEFMGCYGDEHYAGGEPVYRYGFKDTHITERWHESQFESRTPYHTSWDWLMPVVEKIFLLREVKDISIRPGRTRIWLQHSFIQGPHLPGNSSIQECFAAVVEFIQWHNTQNK